jgi:hypothetical protein
VISIYGGRIQLFQLTATARKRSGDAAQKLGIGTSIVLATVRNLKVSGKLGRKRMTMRFAVVFPQVVINLGEGEIVDMAELEAV